MKNLLTGRHFMLADIAIAIAAVELARRLWWKARVEKLIQETRNAPDHR